jgi:catechol 2,3-dioxygenase-like lactoylglutathione lyase family enzyme
MALVKRAHHVSFAVTDVERARAFYEGVLGLEEIGRPDFGFPGAWYSIGDVQVHLIGPVPGFEVGTTPPAVSPVANHVAFAIDDYGATRDALRAKGLELFETGEEMGQLFIRDPDGNVIELIVHREGRRPSR